MKLFYAPGFSSFADHIAMIEAGLQVDLVKVDIWTKQLDGGGDYTDVTPKGYVPALMFDDGEVLTENVAILAWIADRAPQLAPEGERGRYRLIEMLSFLACEIHKRFPIYFSVSDESKPVLREEIQQRFDLLSGRLESAEYLFGDRFTVADPYLFMLARGALQMDFALADCFRDYVARIEARASVLQAERRESLGDSPSPQR